MNNPKTLCKDESKRKHTKKYKMHKVSDLFYIKWR